MTQGMMIARRQRSSNVKPKRNRIGKNDAISTMPDDVLGKILNRVTLKEAVRTSMLSTRWRTQWTSYSGMVDFDYSLRSHELKTYLSRKKRIGTAERCRIFISEWEKFMNGLEHVMEKLKSPSIEGLRVCMDMGNPRKITKWLKFAEEKNLKTLDLDFKYNHPIPFSVAACYNVPNKISPNMFKLKSLHVLCLASVEVSDEAIEGFLASSPQLETLCVKESNALRKLRVSGVGLKLKHLELVSCLYLTSVYISAENLTTFRFVGGCNNINFESIPNLVEASFDGRYSNFLQINMNNPKIAGLLSQLRVLKLKLAEYYLAALDLPVFDNVKELELYIPHEFAVDLERPVSLISAFRSISVLKIKFERTQFKAEEEGHWKAFMGHQLPELTELEISGYKRDPSEIELLITIFRHAPNLKRLVVDPLSPLHIDSTQAVKDWMREANRDTIQWYIDGLKPKVPPSVEVIIL